MRNVIWHGPGWQSMHVHNNPFGPLARDVCYKGQHWHTWLMNPWGQRQISYRYTAMTIMVRFYGVVFSLKWLYSNILLCSLWWRMIWKYQCLKEGIEVECVISYVINLHNKWRWSNLEVQFNWTKWSLKISISCVSKKVFWQTSPCAWNFDAA